MGNIIHKYDNPSKQPTCIKRGCKHLCMKREISKQSKIWYKYCGGCKCREISCNSKRGQTCSKCYNHSIVSMVSEYPAQLGWQYSPENTDGHNYQCGHW